MHLRFRKLIIIAGIILTVLLMSVWSGNNLIVFARGLGSTPPPVSPPPPGTTPIAEPSVEPPDRKLPTWLVTGPSFAGKALHWTQTNYSFQVTGPDPANGQSVRADIWVQVGADGIPVNLHAIWTLPDHSLHQEVVGSGTGTIFIWGAKYQRDWPGGKRMCRQQSPAYPDWLLRGLLPPFADEAGLARSGYRKMAGLTMELPTTSHLASIQPIATYPAGSTSQAWVLQESNNGTTDTKTVVVGANSRVLLLQGQITDVEGKVINETRSVHGSLEVYDPSSLPPTTFTLSQLALDACHD